MKIYLSLILLFFILAFAIRNIKTYLSIQQPIRGRSLKLSFSILLSSLIYCLLFLRITILKPGWIFELDLSGFVVLKIIGFIFVTVGFILGILAMIAMKNSWRVGIIHKQKTDLVTTGIYSFSRNPYFLSYDILIFGYLMIFPSAILLVLYLALAFIFHAMILEEERYLETLHGDAYLNYKKKVGRYFTPGKK